MIARAIAGWQLIFSDLARHCDAKATMAMIELEEFRAEYGDDVDTHKALESVRHRIDAWSSFADFWRSLAGQRR